MASLNFNTENQTFRKIMGNGLKYIVPKFQRDYAWKEEQWDDLWQDMEGLERGEQHYMGYLVLQSSDSRQFTVIDGQQRLTTISILILAVLYKLQELVETKKEPEENNKRLETLKGTFIGFTDPVSLTTQPKLTLNRNNDKFFRTYLCNLDTPPQRNVKASERYLAKACDFFREKLKEKKLETGKELAGFVDDIIDRFLFTTITVGNDLNAYKVFETLNARGVQLSTPDLLKNYLFSIIDNRESLHDEKLRSLEETWEEITGQLGKYDFTRFIHAEWNSRNQLTSKNQLFKKIKQQIDTPEKAFEYLKDLRRSSEVFAALQDNGDEFWEQPNYKSAQGPLETLSIFNITQPHGLLLAAYFRFEADKFFKITKYIEVVSIRYNIVGSCPTNIQERVYNRIARGISTGTIANLQSVKTELMELYRKDSEFVADFQNRHIKTAQSPKKARFLLARLEHHISGVAVDDAQMTLEHVLPKAPSADWVTRFGDDSVEDSVEMLGNMTLLQAAANKDLGNKPFDQKKEVFSQSNLAITKKCAEYESWNREAIEDRQQWLAEHAKSCWRIEI